MFVNNCSYKHPNTEAAAVFSFGIMFLGTWQRSSPTLAFSSVLVSTNLSEICDVYGCSWVYMFKCLSPATSRQLDHLILIGCNDPGQTAGQQHANQLKDRQKNSFGLFCASGTKSFGWTFSQAACWIAPTDSSLIHNITLLQVSV